MQRASDDGRSKLSFFGGKRKFWTVVAVALVAGIVLGSILSVNLLTRPASLSGNAKNDGVYITGTETIKVLSSEGKLVSTWTGPDPITGLTINALAACITGNSTNPIGPASVTGASGSCSSFINEIAIVFAPANYPEIGGTCSANAGAETLNSYSVTGCEATASATNYLTPLGCWPNSSTAASTPPLCTGWTTESTFGPGTFTSTNCIYNQAATPCSVVQVDAGTSQMNPYPAGYGNGEGFDYVNPTPIPVSAGDSLLVTIQFSIS